MQYVSRKIVPLNKKGKEFFNAQKIQRLVMLSILEEESKESW